MLSASLLLLLPLAALLDVVSAKTPAILPMQVRAKLFQQQQAEAKLTPIVAAQYPLRRFTQKVDHFLEDDRYAPHTNKSFNQRYWVDDFFYKPGGPVFIFDGGEGNAAPFVAEFKPDTGLIGALAQRFKGMQVVLEHRYGNSQPFPTLTTDNYRFLSVEQALADTDYWVRNVELPSMGLIDLDTTPVIHVGGSYPGARSAFLRKAYPDSIYGSIASSAVTKAIVSFPEYYDGISNGAEPACVEAIENSVALIDNVIESGNKSAVKDIKRFFRMSKFSDLDFARTIANPLGYWQSRSEYGTGQASQQWDLFCRTITSPPQTQNITSDLRALLGPLEPYARFFTERLLVSDANYDDGSANLKVYQANDLAEQEWKSWMWQYCSEFGYFIVAKPEGQKSLVSRQIDVQAEHEMCHNTFPPGRYNRLAAQPEIERVDKYGGWQLKAPRISWANGEFDPWRYVTPASPDARPRVSTTAQPFSVIANATHCWDLTGVNSYVPPAVALAHTKHFRAVRAWLKEFAETR